MSDKDKLAAEKVAHKATKAELKTLKAQKTALEKKFKEDMISVNKDQGTIEFRTIVGDIHPIILEWFTGSKVTREIQFSRIREAVRIGLLAQMQGRIGHALSTYKEHMDEELSLLRHYTNIFEEKFKTDSKFKTDQEKTVLKALQTYINELQYQDTVIETGTSTNKDGNKTGDILATIQHQGVSHELAIEVKYATDFKRGGVGSKSNVKSSFRTDTDTSTSQLIEARLNRKTRYAIIVLDHSLNLKSTTPLIEFLPEAAGFIVKTDLLSGDFSALKTAYEIVRQMTISSSPINLDYSILEFLLTDLNSILKRQGRITKASESIIKQLNKSHKDNIEKVIEITELFEADLVATRQTMEQTQRIIGQFLKTGKITADDAFETYVKKRANNEWKVAKDQTSDWLNAFNQRTLEENTTLPAPEKGTAHTEANLNKLSKNELINLCVEKRIPKSGTKAVLMARLLE
jgi:hypothetical protein